MAWVRREFSQCNVMGAGHAGDVSATMQAGERGKRAGFPRIKSLCGGAGPTPLAVARARAVQFHMGRVCGLSICMVKPAEGKYHKNKFIIFDDREIREKVYGPNQAEYLKVERHGTVVLGSPVGTLAHRAANNTKTNSHR